ncbi:MAG: epoxyqueuosine reductase QueH [Oscillospiraceae bacterium]|jgi:predicted adenine nucleotide alpha hydrolase (AANH) superfamily ATPase
MIKVNYQKELDDILAHLHDIKSVPRLLLHSCCGPCSSYVLEYLTQYFSVTVLFYNPNIQPEAEYQKRLAWQERLIAALPVKYPVTLLKSDWEGAAFTGAVQGQENEPEGGSRCTSCFVLRLTKTAELAKSMGFDYFCTTLTVSPHKDAQRINHLGYEIGERLGVAWLPSDFKKREGYKRSIQLSADYGLYRQNYCGCLYSRPKTEE